jgi:methylmalonyl-CoA mutase N-terminal domain/subunit
MIIPSCSRQIESFGGVIKAIEAGFFQREIAEAAYRHQREIDDKRRVMVGVNDLVANEPMPRSTKSRTCSARCWGCTRSQ